MKHFTLTSILALFLIPVLGQQVLFSEDFEGAQPAFTLNTVDMSSVAGVAGANYWLINNAYTGGSGTLDCFGFPFTFTIPNTPAQPGGITNANGKYLHITSAAGSSSGVVNSNFAAADGLCTNAGNHFTRMSSDVSTVGATEVSLDFWWLCAGGPNSYGELYYSADAGTSWNLVSTPIAAYRNQSTWVQQTVSLPAFVGQATLRFGFRFVNAMATAASDPAFGIDDVSITSISAENSIETDALTSTTYCPESTANIPYTVTGTWDTGNVFTAELSDITGSFASPLAIGSATSTTSGTIVATIPASTATGTGYLIRVTGSDPATIASNTTAVITIMDAPYAGENDHMSFCENDDPQVLIDLLPGASTCGAWTGPDGAATSDILDPSVAISGTYTYTTNCPGGCPQDQAELVIGIVPAPDAGESVTVIICENDPAFNLLDSLGGTPNAGGTWSGPTVVIGGIFNPVTMPSGCYTYTVAGTAPCPNATATVCVTEEICTGIGEVEGGLSAPHWLGQRGNTHQIRVGADKPSTVELFDASGRQLEAMTNLQGDRLTINMSGAHPGMYLVRVTTDGRVATLRMIHQ
ncbi:MAG: T9SS type A sorting domain-containing protein [Flavobacteriales bacterium]